MSAPVIGLTTFHTRLPHKSYFYIAVTEAYVQAIIQAGGIPILIPLGLPEVSLQELVKSLDGILFTGGGDLDPRLYGAQPKPFLKNVDPERDRVELHLVKEAVDKDIPFLGICRGLQTVNVALGGTLYADILQEVPEALKHNCFQLAPRDYLAHTIEIQEDSRLAKILGQTNLGVNSGHHQAVHQLGPGLHVSAHAPDGTVEAFELPNHVFGLAVQWHPEWLTHIPEMQAIFQAFIQAAQKPA